MNRKNPRYIMNKADNQNSTYRRIIMVSKTSDDSSLSHTKWNDKYHIVYLSLSTEEKQYRANIEAVM